MEKNPQSLNIMFFYHSRREISKFKRRVDDIRKNVTWGAVSRLNFILRWIFQRKCWYNDQKVVILPAD